jgi:transcriptional/translational regulatory protein YebC/TACO1
MSTIYELVKGGAAPVVSLRKSTLANNDQYGEAGMRARVTSIIEEADEIIRVVINYTEFKKFNRLLETADYYLDGKMVKASDVDMNVDSESLYLNSISEIDEELSLLDDMGNDLIFLYQSSVDPSEKSYVQFLEDIARLHFKSKTN